MLQVSSLDMPQGGFAAVRGEEFLVGLGKASGNGGGWDSKGPRGRARRESAKSRTEVDTWVDKNGGNA
eukprot:429844-Prymnesium_polylepis.1